MEKREAIAMEYERVRSDLSDFQKIPERWGAIMLPLAAGIFAVAVNSIVKLPTVGVVLLVFLSISTIIIWRLIGYNAMYRTSVLFDRARKLEAHISKGEMEILYDRKWESFQMGHSSFLPKFSQRALLYMFAFLYIITGLAIIYVKVAWI